MTYDNIYLKLYNDTFEKLLALQLVNLELKKELELKNEAKFRSEFRTLMRHKFKEPIALN